MIDQAKGVLMFGYGVDADTAFGLLMRWSQNTNTKVRDLAAALVLSLSNGNGTGDLPALARGGAGAAPGHPPRPGAGRLSRVR
ncbi:MAG: ANTAR domain-containing protein [Nocardioides sp.]|nr:ANTAR domain-containing protein [Nocardioides sp.]